MPKLRSTNNVTVLRHVITNTFSMRQFFTSRKIVCVFIILILFIQNSCISRSQKPATITIKGVLNGMTYPPGTVLKPMINVEPETARVELQADLNGLSFPLGTTIQEPGEYRLRVKARGNGVHETKLIHFSILMQVNVKAVRWSFRPYPDGTADLEVVLVMLNPPVPIDRLSPSSCLLHLWVQQASTQPQKVDVKIERIVHLKNRATGKIEGALLYFKADRSILMASRLVLDEEHPAYLKGVFYASVPKPFEERVRLDKRNRQNNSLKSILLNQYTLDLYGGVLGKPLPEGVDTIDEAL